MIRIIAKHDNCGMAAHLGGSVLSQIKTFDFELPELEQYLLSANNDTYSHVQVIGVELLQPKETK